ncbi:DNA translocase FtsK [Sporolactobacillus terrae]|uniref:DNA translocase FtsK n=1 Tax=Sporolactobacillus terrae TaxID=269673 RepID=UPI0011187998|nr:DNA translocase FtsK [Sporolactobacillus terrae]
MADKWWRKYFSMDSEDEPDRRETPLENEQTSASVGRFKDPNRKVEVKMLARYPEHVRADTSFDRDNSSKSKRSADKRDEAPKPKKKPPFHPTRVPSPVFGFRKPNQAKEAEGYLDVKKEDQEKRQIEAYRQEELNRSNEKHPSIADQPTIDRTIADQPAINRTKDPLTDREATDVPADPLSETDQRQVPLNEAAAEPAATHRQDEQPDSVFQEAEPPAEMVRQETAPASQESTIQQKKEPIRVTSRLPRSPFRQERQSKVPFNVLMFHTDRRNSTTVKEWEPAQQATAPSDFLLPLELLHDAATSEKDSASWIEENKAILVETLENFHVDADVVGYVQGPSVTRFDLHLHPGVKINKVLSLTEDIKLSLAARQIRIAPVLGTSSVGIEIPNKVRRPVLLKELVTSKNFRESKAPLIAALGQDVSGNQVVTDLAKMPHGLIAGATGSGKSVCIHSLILSLIYRTSPEDLRFLLIDPKVVELAPYQELPHLAAPVITEPKEAAAALKWAVDEMEQRYRTFAECAVRDMDGYNRKRRSGQIHGDKMPYIVIVIDELADLMMAAPQDVEESICRIAQKARAAGIHLLVATQRPSVDVITGLIKSNIPTRIAFSVSSQTDSRTILDCSGAERLLGRGDLLFAENGSRSLRRLQACYVSDEEIGRVTHAFHDWQKPEYLFSPEAVRTDYERSEQEDELLGEAAAFVVAQGQASVSAIQRHFRIGYNRAARLADELEMRNIISASNGSKPRQVLVSKEKLSERLGEPD